MPADFSRIPQEFYDAVEQGQLPAARIGPMLDEYVAQQLLAEVKAGRIPRPEAMAHFNRIRANQKAHQDHLERQAFRQGAWVHAPETYPGAAASAALTTAPTKWLGRLFGSPMTWRHAANLGMGAASLPFSGVFEAGLTAIAPLSDPLYQRGERGYFGSLAEAAKGRTERFARAGEETMKHYGAAGIPVQALQHAFNPLTGTAFTAKELYKSMHGPSAEELSMQAERDLDKYLGR